MQTKPRDSRLDVTRGLCVLAMTVHHAINYFPAYTLIPWRFVSGAFPFLAGYLLTGVLLPSGLNGKRQRDLGWRLLWRGSKLLLLCIAINAVLNHALPASKGPGTALWRSLGEVLIWGDYRTVFFSLLVPLAYTIALGGILSMLDALRPNIVILSAVVLSAYCTVAEVLAPGAYYLPLLSIGLIGMACGYASPAIDAMKGSSGAAAALAPWLVVVSLTSYFGKVEFYPVYCVSIAASLLAIHFVAGRVVEETSHAPLFELLGKYSLVLYLAQIALLVALRKVFGHAVAGRELMFFWAVLAGVCLAQLGLSVALERMRRHIDWFDRSYRTLFH